MDRTQAFAEYAHILGDFEDSLSGGFRRIREEQAIRIPVQTMPDADAPVQESAYESSSSAPASDPGLAAPGRAVSPASGPGPAGSAGGPGTDVSPSLQRPADSQSVEALKTVAGEIAVCRNCNLYLMRENTVPGIGSPGATLMIVTPPPVDSASELTTPLPAFEQEYLEKWLVALELDPSRDVFITPAVKCRTPGARPPQSEEAAACTGFLRRQYKAVAPRAVLALGSSGCGALTGNPGDFPSLVGRDWNWGAVPALVLWTPAEVLANPGRLRGPVWESLKRLKASWNAVPGS